MKRDKGVQRSDEDVEMYHNAIAPIVGVRTYQHLVVALPGLPFQGCIHDSTCRGRSLVLTAWSVVAVAVFLLSCKGGGLCCPSRWWCLVVYMFDVVPCGGG